jgi:hypothetical protein
MRIVTFFFAALFSCAACFGQATTGSESTPEGSNAEQTVAILLADGGQAPVPGFVQALVTRLGDGAAVGVIQYLGDRKESVAMDATTPEEIERILYIVRTAFQVPNNIESAENRSPKATLILLQYLSTLSAARTIRGNLKSTGNFIEQVKASQSKKKT